MQLNNNELLEEYDKAIERITKISTKLKQQPDDEFLRDELKSTKKYKKKIQIELELRGINV